MAERKGSNKTKFDSSPRLKINPGQYNSVNKTIFDEYTGPIANGDTILFGAVIPEGALIKSAKLLSTNGGATGILDLGAQAFVDIDGNDVAASQNGLVNQADAGGQAVNKRDDANSSLIGQTVGKGGAQIVATCTEAFAVDSTIKILVDFTLES